MKKRNIRIWPYLIGFLIFLILANYIFTTFFSSGVERVEIPYTSFKNFLEEDQVIKVHIEGQKITGQFVGKITRVTNAAGETVNQVQYFLTYKPPVQDQELMTLIDEKGVTLTAKPTGGTSWLPLIAINLLPFLLLIGIWIYMAQRMRQQAGGGGGIFQVGKTKAKLYSEETPGVNFSDVAGLENPKKEVREIIDFLKNPGKFREMGIEIPTGLLLMGPPGTGKTLLAKAVAGEAEVPFFSASGSEFVEMFVGVGASRVRDLFEKAKSTAPAIVFIDELDAVGRARGAGIGGGHDEREQTLNQLLGEMDGFEPYEGVVIIGATNRPDVLDQALLRPGRFDRQITIHKPRMRAREKILEIHTRDKPVAEDVDLEVLAKGTPGLTGADLENLVNEAAIYTARDNKKLIEMEHFEKARDKILMGVEREDIMLEKEKEIIAYHEAGHAVVAKMLPDADPLHKISIIPRGQAMGATQQLPEERYNLPKSYLEAKLAVTLGGRASEQIFMTDISTGAQNDFKEATRLARRMVTQWGFSDKIGPMNIKQAEEHVFLGREIAQERDISERTAQIVDEEVQKILDNALNKATETLKAKREIVKDLAELLIGKEALEKEELEEYFKKYNLEDEDNVNKEA